MEDGDLLDIVIYCWSPSADTYWYMDDIRSGSNGPHPDFLFQGFYEYHCKFFCILRQFNKQAKMIQLLAIAASCLMRSPDA